MLAVLPGRALVAWRQTILPVSECTNVWPGLNEDLEKKSAALEAIHTALEKPAIVFNLDYSQGFNSLLPCSVPRFFGELFPTDFVATWEAATRCCGEVLLFWAVEFLPNRAADIFGL